MPGPAVGAMLAGFPGMFQMDIAEYVRLSYESLEAACVAHAAEAARLSRLSAWFRGATLGCAAIAAGFSAVAASGRPGWALAAAIAAAVAFVFQQAAPADRCTFELAQRALGQRPASPAVPVAG